MTRCPNTLRGHHKFEPRYDLSPADMSQFTGMSEFSMSTFSMEKLRAKTYVRDVCVRCGQTIERAKP